MSSSQPSSLLFSASHPPKTLCLLRLSALGDITHVLPTLRTLQAHWPTTKIYWIIGVTEYQLVKDISNIEFILFNKSAGFTAYLSLKNKIKQLGIKHFDILLHLQLSLRASLASLFIPARIKLGFDKKRSKDLQYWFCNHHIVPVSTRQHVLDSFLEFTKFFSLSPVMQWQLPVSPDAITRIHQKLNSDKAIFVINPCAVAKSKNWRNWSTIGYAKVSDYVCEKYGKQIVLSGGNSQLEIQTALEIIALCKIAKPINLVAKTTIAELAALLKIAQIVLAPDTGPVHIASALQTKTIGLYSATNPQRAGPYRHQQFVVNKYPEALANYNNKTIDSAPWGERIKTKDCMQLIHYNDVILQIDTLITIDNE